MLAVRTEGLTHRYSRETVLRQVDLSVPARSIYGFLGPNGAGKTTTLRVLLGLLRRQQGTIEIFGRTLERHRLEILRQTGSSVEIPSVYGHLTAVENLEVWRRMFRSAACRIPHVLDLVGLADTGSKRVDQFSLGMKQRLSIAVALLHEPTLLILDEPTNSLDPHGILEMRRLFEMLNREQGITILVSSHMLSEIEKLVTHIGIIHHGSMRFQGTLDELLVRQQVASFTTVDTSNPLETLAVAAQQGITGDRDGKKVRLRPLARDEAGRLTAALAANRIDVFEITTVRKDLEHIFLELIGDQ